MGVRRDGHLVSCLGGIAPLFCGQFVQLVGRGHHRLGSLDAGSRRRRLFRQLSQETSGIAVTFLSQKPVAEMECSIPRDERGTPSFDGSTYSATELFGGLCLCHFVLCELSKGPEEPCARS